uniref:Putative secreted protein n=1 Tax=Anopheles darlingi TaxID=43151 RepID=A0A2M4DE81_ANODA
MLFRDRTFVLILVWYCHWLLLYGQIYERGKRILQIPVLRRRRGWLEMVSIWSRARRFGGATTDYVSTTIAASIISAIVAAADTAAAAAAITAGIVTLDDSLSLGWWWCSMWTRRVAVNRGYSVHVVSCWRSTATVVDITTLPT